MREWDALTDWDEVRGLAPEAFDALDRMRACAERVSVPPEVASAPAVAAYADQFNVDVANLTPEQRGAAADVLGDDLFAFLQQVWVRDMAGRADQAWRRLLAARPHDGPDQGTTEGPDAATELWAAVDAFLPAVARLSALDPVATEIVRLRGARAHDCRLCRSLRSVGAVEAGADEHSFDAVDRYETSDLDERLKVALRLTDAVIWTPRNWPSGVAASVRREFSPAEAVEIVFDVVRNGANKIAVALEADAPHVTSGVEYFSMGSDGELVYGLAAPPGPS